MMAAGRRVYIIGFMGCGKSSAGKKLAKYLGWRFADLDEEIEIVAGKSIEDIFSSEGEDHFRKLESMTLTNLKTDSDTIISTGGGTPCYNNNMDFMIKTGSVVYLRMTPGQLNSRLKGASTSRPLIKNINPNELLQYISDKLLEREIYYLKASLIVNAIDFDIRSLGAKINARSEDQAMSE
jgi:shikimate kinase